MDTVGRGGRIQEHAHTGDLTAHTEEYNDLLFCSLKMEQSLASVTATTFGEYIICVSLICVTV